MHTPAPHRIYFNINNLTTWYAIMREARQQFGSGWSSQPRFRRKLQRVQWNNGAEWCWFCVPDPAFGTWISVKLGVGHSHQPGK